MRRKRSGHGFASRLFKRGPESLETLLARALGLSGRRLVCVSVNSVEVATESRVISAWTESATEPKARAFLGTEADADKARFALQTLCLPLACRFVEEAPISEGDARVDGVDLRFFIVTKSARLVRDPRANGVQAPSPGQPILALRGSAPGEQALASLSEKTSASPPPERLIIEAPAAPGVLSCIVPYAFEVARGVEARVLARFLRPAGPADASQDGTRFRCSLSLGKGSLAWTQVYPALPPADPSSDAARARFGALANAQTLKAASFLASLGISAGDARAEAMERATDEKALRLIVDAELRLGLRDLPLRVELDKIALETLARLAGLKADTPARPLSASAPIDPMASEAEAELARFLEANRRLGARLAPLSRKAFAAKPGLAYLLQLLDAGDRARLVSRLIAAIKPTELIAALYARDASSGRPLPRAFFRTTDLLDSAPGLWSEDFKIALAKHAARLAQDEVSAAEQDLALLGFLDQELRAGRLELSARGASLLAPLREQSRTEEEKALLELCSGDGLWKLIGGAGRRLGASALLALTDRSLAMASVVEIERRAELAPLMSRGRRRAFAEEAAWVDTRYATGDLSPGACAEARRLALSRFKTRLGELKRTEAAERAHGRDRSPA